MLDAIKPLLDSDLINEETRTQIEEAWGSKLTEAKEQVRAELREEFAQRYEHDKSVMVEALDRMVTENLTAELAEFAEEKKQLSEDRAKFVGKMQSVTETFDKFLVTQLAEEITELNADRQAQNEHVAKLEQFITHQLAEEISDFQQDRQDVVETKVRLVKEAREQFKTLKHNFVETSAKLVKETVSKHLNAEITQLREDIQTAGENNFGRRIFEAVAAEFSASYLNENQEIKDLKKIIESKETALAEAEVAIAEKNQLVESKTKEISMITESTKRSEVMNSLLKPLNKDKSAVMRDLLESVQTSKLQAAYDRYLPVVLDGKAAPRAEKQMVAESRTVVTGDKEVKHQVTDAHDDNVVELRKLAGLK
jgi:predicted DNA-binding protein